MHVHTHEHTHTHNKLDPLSLFLTPEPGVCVLLHDEGPQFLQDTLVNKSKATKTNTGFSLFLWGSGFCSWGTGLLVISPSHLSACGLQRFNWSQICFQVHVAIRAFSFLQVVRLRTSFPCWLSVGSCLQLRAARPSHMEVHNMVACDCWQGQGEGLGPGGVGSGGD